MNKLKNVAINKETGLSENCFKLSCKKCLLKENDKCKFEEMFEGEDNEK